MANTTPGYIDEKTIVPLQANIETPDYKINYGDERFAQVEQEKDAALGKLTETYDGIIKESDNYYQQQIDATNQWGEKQQQLQQEQTDFAIEQIKQQKDQANKDYIKEQSGAYTDWQKQSNQYGVNAEKQAAAGLAGTGYSESAQVAMYNQYQNRVAMARESFTRAVLNYDNAMKDAILQNNAKLAEIAAQTLQKSLELSLQGFQYKNNLILEKTNKEIEMDKMYYDRYKDVLAQLNQENAMAEQIRQYNQQLQLEIDKHNQDYALEIQKYNEGIRQWQATYDQGIIEYKEQIRQWEAEMERLKKKDDAEAKAEKARLAEQIKQREQQQTQWEAEMKLKKEALEQEKAAIKAASSGGSGSSDATIARTSSSTATVSNKSDGTYVKTDYYKGTLPARTASAVQEFGAFSNGYQPKGIHGSGKVSKTGVTFINNTVTLDGKSVRVEQNVWATPDGKLWYWEGREMKYKPVPSGAGGGGGSGSKPIARAVK